MTRDFVDISGQERTTYVCNELSLSFLSPTSSTHLKEAFTLADELFGIDLERRCVRASEFSRSPCQGPRERLSLNWFHLRAQHVVTCATFLWWHAGINWAASVMDSPKVVSCPVRRITSAVRSFCWELSGPLFLGSAREL